MQTTERFISPENDSLTHTHTPKRHTHCLIGDNNMPCKPNKEPLAFNSKNAPFSWCRRRLFFDRSLQFVAPGVFSYRYWIKPGGPGRPSSSRLFKCHTRRMQEWSSCWLIRPVLGFLGSLSAFPEETRLRACFYPENGTGFSISFINMLCALWSIHFLMLYHGNKIKSRKKKS